MNTDDITYNERGNTDAFDTGGNDTLPLIEDKSKRSSTTKRKRVPKESNIPKGDNEPSSETSVMQMDLSTNLLTTSLDDQQEPLQSTTMPIGDIPAPVLFTTMPIGEPLVRNFSTESELLARVKTLEDEMVEVKKELVHWQKVDETNCSELLKSSAEMYSIKTILSDSYARISTLDKLLGQHNETDKNTKGLREEIDTLKTANATLERSVAYEKNKALMKTAFITDAVNRVFYVHTFGESEEGSSFCAISKKPLTPTEPVFYLRGIECECNSFVKTSFGLKLYKSFLNKEPVECPACKKPIVLVQYTTSKFQIQQNAWQGLRELVEFDTLGELKQKHAQFIEVRKKIERDEITAPFRSMIEQIQGVVGKLHPDTECETHCSTDTVDVVDSSDAIDFMDVGTLTN
ncbi:hypothetical protein T484DRAFT_1745164 [Baffinella frigidus]|nr:hypothetical protein T484DRAFT_1745164 [Cryptophyta sp. CCMP2293]